MQWQTILNNGLPEPKRPILLYFEVYDEYKVSRYLGNGKWATECFNINQELITHWKYIEPPL
ncbi:hypothetical protein BMT54_06975 [Pasteurellaceae bacterium 15-036681]|nr:hypothetical protein BMT54_06975 [Pasteurellaceae bacterium 15-036681]